MSIIRYDYRKNEQISKHFFSNDFASIANGKLYTNDILIDTEFIEKLENFFDFGIQRIEILSGYRVKEADIAVGGNGRGAHTLGFAADIILYKNDRAIESKYTACLAEMIGFTGIGITGPTGCHVDTRSADKYPNGHWFGDERNGFDDVDSFFNYCKVTKQELDTVLS